MPITITPDTPLNQVRLNIGDDTGKYISDDTINGLLLAYDNNVKSATLKAFDYIIAQAASLVDETTDEVSVKWSQIYKQYKELKASFAKGDLGGEGSAAFFFGGTSKTENDKYYNDPNNTGCPIKVGDAFSDGDLEVNPYDRFSF